MNIMFLDIDGVLNCQLHYESKQFENYKAAKKQLRKDVKSERIERLDYYKSQLCNERIGWLNALCQKVNIKVVISSTWRMGKTIKELQEILSSAGATFEIIGKTPDLGSDCVRGNEIYEWIKDNEAITGCPYYDYKSYVIIDDDSDMLLWQQPHFFQTDNYSGLTPTTCYKVGRFFGRPTFEMSNNEQNDERSDAIGMPKDQNPDNQIKTNE